VLRIAAKAGELLPRSQRGALRLAVAVGLLLLALLLLRTLAQSHLRRTATNDLLPVAELTLAPGTQSCQAEALVPAGTGSVTFPVHSAGPAPGSVQVSVAGSSGTVAAPPQLTYVFLRLTPVVRSDQRDTQVCLRNDGATPVVLRGASPPGAPVRARLDWYRPAPQRNWSLGSTISSRFPLQKAPFLGPWALWLVLLLVAAVSAAGLVWATRRADR
jgi:hypothetical protein